MSSDSRRDANTFARFFEEPADGLEPTQPELPVVKSRRRKSALLVDPATSSTTNRRVLAVERPKSVEVSDLVEELSPNALTCTLEVSSREYQQILRAAEALRFEELSFDGNDPFSGDPFDEVEDSPDLARAQKATLKCAPWSERDTLSAPRPITLAGDEAPSAPAEVTLDGEVERLNASFEEDAFEEDGYDEDASFDERILEAVDPFGLAGIEVVEEQTGEWTAPELSLERLPTRVSEPTETDIRRGRELYNAALEELALQRKTAALVHARLALGYDPDNGNYQAFVEDLLKMIGHSADLSASGSLPVMDEDIISWDGRSLG